MKRYVTIDKRSKKAQKEYYSKQRGTWGEINPVTRSVPSGKIYNRNKDKQKNRKIGREFRDGFDADFICYGDEASGAVLAQSSIRRPLIRARFAKRISSLLL